MEEHVAQADPPARSQGASALPGALPVTSRWQKWAWTGLRCVVLIALALYGLRPPRPLVVLGPQRSVESVDPAIGVHTRLTDEVEEWKIKQTLEMVREMGASWVVEYFPWQYSEPAKGVYDWAHADMVIAHARRQGLNVIARIGFVPDWARPPDTEVSYLDPARYADLGDFVGAFAARYRGEVDYLIVWNEPNLGLEWGYRDPDPAEYAEMLRIAYARAKEANPEIVVLGGALSPTLGAPDAMGDLDYLQGMYDAGAASYFDALAVHAYGWRFPTDAPPATDAINYRRTELLRQIMVRNGDAHKPLMITEGGWNDHPRWTKAVSPRLRVAYTVQAYAWARHEWPWCKAVALWAFRFPRPEPGYLNYYSFVTTEFTPRPVYHAVQQYARGEDVSKWLSP
ncbi:MAG: beta-galactosidase [Anaerolineae bacterium]|nr:beta-galactosidase [Anaerolineae bacterium]